MNIELLPEGVEMAKQIKAAIAEQVIEWPDGMDAKRLNNSLACLISMSKLLSETR